MKKCPFCARVLENSDAFCPGCGNNVSGTAVSDPVTESKGKKGSKKPLIIIIAILAVLLAGIIGVVVLDVTGVIDISSVFSDEEDKKTEAEAEDETEAEAEAESDIRTELLNDETETKTHYVKPETVVITFPEGCTVDQIIEKLESNGVCSAEDFRNVMFEDDIYNKYEFLSGVSYKQFRYHTLEGFLYPGTYEFCRGESPLSVAEKFLDNFEEKWSDEYSARAAELGYTAEEIIIIASIIEKEALNPDHKSVISSVIHNRLKSSAFTKLECDSTGAYIYMNEDNIESIGIYSDYLDAYDTYRTTGLPAGAICCPGAESIYAALYFEDTDYYFFDYDYYGSIYLAETLSQHQKNWEEIARVSESIY